MANTPPPPPLSGYSTDALLNEICVELRYVGVNESQLPNGERVLSHIESVCALQRELNARSVNIDAKLSELSSQTGWLAKSLLEDCLAFPNRMPYVRELDGIRRRLRCTRCRLAERHPEAKLIWFCDDCLATVIAAMKVPEAIDGVVLFRTYNSDCRCEHANSETILACDINVESLSGVCARCLECELKSHEENPPIGL